MFLVSDVAHGPLENIGHEHVNYIRAYDPGY